MPKKMNQYLKRDGNPLVALDSSKRDRHKYARDRADMGLPKIGKIDSGEYTFGYSHKKNAKSQSAKGLDKEYSRFTSSHSGFSSPFFSSKGWLAEEEHLDDGAGFGKGVFTMFEASANRGHEKRLAETSMIHVERERSRDRSLADKDFLHVTHKMPPLEPYGPPSTSTTYIPKDFEIHGWGELTDHEKRMERQHSAQGHARSMLSIAEGHKTHRSWLAGLFNHKNEKARHKANARAGELALARDKARYRHISRENRKAAKRERRRIVVQRGYY